MALYRPLSDAFDDFNTMLRESQIRNAQHEARMAELGLQKQLGEAQIQQQMAEAERKAQAHQMLSQAAQTSLNVDPYNDRMGRIDSIIGELSTLKEQSKALKGDVRFAPQRLTVEQNISALTSEQNQLASEINNPELMANEYRALATEHQNLALQLAGLDPRLATVLMQTADNRLAQANNLVSLINATKQAKETPKSQLVKVFDRETGELLRIKELTSGDRLQLGANETTQPPGEESQATQLIRFYDKETGEEVGAAFWPKAGKIDVPEGIVTERPPKAPSETGKLTESQGEFIIERRFSTLSPEGKIIGPIKGLGQKMRTLKSAYRSELVDVKDRAQAVANITENIDGMERLYWQKHNAIMADPRLSGSQKKQGVEKLKKEFKEDMLLLTKSKKRPGVFYIPDQFTKRELGVE